MQGVPPTKSGIVNNLSVLSSNKLTSPCQLVLITLCLSALAVRFCLLLVPRLFIKV